MNTENMIEITGVDLKEAAKAAYALSKPQGLGLLHAKQGDLSDSEAEDLINDGGKVPLSMDYVNGRACKFDVFRYGDKLFIRNYWYDHSPEQLTELLERILPKSSPSPEAA